jgi:hypothetical protein
MKILKYESGFITFRSFGCNYVADIIDELFWESVSKEIFALVKVTKK